MEKLFYIALLCTVSLCSSEGNVDPRLSVIGQHYEFPYAVSIQDARQPNPILGHICGGGLVTYSHVLTAAVCMFNPQDMLSGIYTLNNPQHFMVFSGASLLTDTTSERTRGVSAFTPHPLYIGLPSNVNDIGVITLSTSFPNNTGIVPIALSNAIPADNTQCTVAGWGSTVITEPASVALHYFNKYVFNQNSCTQIYGIQSTYPNIMSSMMCATSLNIRSQNCHGASGNLLVCNGALSGVLSWYQCYETSYPEMYTRTSNYTTWIRDITGDASASGPTIAILSLAIILNILNFS